MIETLSTVFAHMSTAQYWIAFLTGLAIATVLGLIPGLGATLMMAIAFPIVILTIKEPAIGIVMLAVITGTGNTFDSLPAQLMGITTGGTQVSFLEGHQLARKGLGAYSLGAVYAVSAIGGIIGAASLFLVMQIATPLITALSFSEIAVISLFGLSMVAVLSKGAMLKGLTSAMLGVLMGTVGLQTFTNTERFIFAIYDLRAGLPLVATIAGVMAIPEMLDLAAARKPVAPPDAVVTNQEVFRGFREGLRRWKLAVRHSILGVLLGALPGTGGSFVTWLSYGIGIAGSKDKSQFGKGSLDGLLFAESSENAKEGGQAIPSLALGIPGSTSWALVVAALLAYGISPGGKLMTDHADIVWLIVFSFALANLLITILALFITRQVMRVTQIPYPAIVGTMLPIVVLGSYFSDRMMVVIPLLVLMTLLGLMMKHFRWPRPPFVLGFILAAPIEENLFTAVNVSGGWGMLTRPVTIIMAIISIAVVFHLLRSMNRTDVLVEETLHSDGELRPEIENFRDPISGELIGPRAEAAAPDRGEAAAGTGVASPITSPPRPEKMEEKARQSAGLRMNWRSEHWVALFFTLIGIYALHTSLGYDRLAANLLPTLMAGGIVITAGGHLLMLVFSQRNRNDNVLDIAMRSVGIEGARQAAIKLGALIAVYLVAIYAIGLHWAGFVLAIFVPLVLMKESKRYLAAAVSAVLYFVFVTGIGDELLNVRWPSGFLF